MSLNPDTLLKNFDVGRATGLRGAQFRQAQREKLSEKNLAELKQARSLGQQLQMFSEGADGELIVGDNFFADGPQADRVRKSFINNTSLGKTLKFIKKDGSFEQAELLDFVPLGDGAIGLNLRKPDGTTAAATQNASEDPNDLVQAVDYESFKEILKPAMLEYNMASIPGYYERLRSKRALGEAKQLGEEIQTLEQDKALLDRIKQGDMQGVSPVELRSLIEQRLTGEIETALEEDDFATDPRDGASYEVAPGDNLKNRIVSAATDTPVKPKDVDKDAETTTETPADQSTGPLGLYGPYGIGPVVDFFKHPVVKDIAKGDFATAEQRLITINGPKALERDRKGLQNIDKELEKLRNPEPAPGKTTMGDVEERNAKIKLLERRKVTYQERLLKTKNKIKDAQITISQKTQDQEPGPNSVLKKGEVENRILSLDSYENLVRARVENPEAADLQAFADKKQAELLKGKGVNSYEDLITSKKLSYTERTNAAETLAFEAADAYVQARGSQEAVAVYGIAKTFYEGMYMDIINGTPTMTEYQMEQLKNKDEDQILAQQNFDLDLTQRTDSLLEKDKEILTNYTTGIVNENGQIDLDSQTAKAAFQRARQSARNYMNRRKSGQITGAPLPEEISARETMALIIDDYLLKLAKQKHDEKWWILGEKDDFHLWFVDYDHEGKSGLTGNRLDIAPKIVNGQLRGLTFDPDGDLELTRNEIERAMGDGALDFILEYAQFFDATGTSR